MLRPGTQNWLFHQERGLASQRPLGRPAVIMPNLTHQMFCWKIADKFDLDLRVMIIVWVSILHKIWAHLAPNTIKMILQKIGNFCHQIGRSLYSPYYKVGIAENLGTLANKILRVYILLTIVILQKIWAHMPPKSKESGFSILQRWYSRKFVYISHQNGRGVG